MQEILIELANLTPVNVLAKKIIESANKVIDDPNDENNKKELTFMCSIWMSKDVLNKLGGSENMINKFKKFKKENFNESDDYDDLSSN